MQRNEKVLKCVGPPGGSGGPNLDFWQGVKILSDHYLKNQWSDFHEILQDCSECECKEMKRFWAVSDPLDG